MGAISRRSSSRTRTATAVAGALAVGALVAGCAFDASTLSVPAPFRPSEKSLTEAAFLADPDVIVVPPELPEPIERAFLFGLAREAGDADILILTKPPLRPAHMLEGIATKDGRIVWHLRLAGGGPGAHFAGPKPVRPEEAAKDGRETAQLLIAALGRGAPPPAPRRTRATVDPFATPIDDALDAVPASPAPARADPAASSAPSVFVGEIAGAPGDGNLALRTALTEILRRSPFAVAPRVEGATFVIAADVTAAALDAEAEQLTIVWRLTDRTGADFGTLTQANAVPAGLLEGPWGELAYDIALGAAQGLGEALAAGQKR